MHLTIVTCTSTAHYREWNQWHGNRYFSLNRHDLGHYSTWPVEILFQRFHNKVFFCKQSEVCFLQLLFLAIQVGDMSKAFFTVTLMVTVPSEWLPYFIREHRQGWSTWSLPWGHKLQLYTADGYLELSLLNYLKHVIKKVRIIIFLIELVKYNMRVHPSLILYVGVGFLDRMYGIGLEDVGLLFSSFCILVTFLKILLHFLLQH